MTLRRTLLGPLTPGYQRYISAQSALRVTVALRLSDRFCADKVFRSSVLDAAQAMGHDGDELPATDRSSLEKSALEHKSKRYRLIVKVVDMEPLLDDLLNELPFIAERSRGSNADIYDNYYRLQAEGDFRLAIFFPVAALFGVLAIQGQPFWWAGTAASFVLLYLGVESRKEAANMLSTAMASGRIDDSALQKIDVAEVGFQEEARDIN